MIVYTPEELPQGCFLFLLSNGKLLITPNHVYAGSNKLDLTKDTNTVYTHPSTKQCSWEPSGVSNLVFKQMGTVTYSGHSDTSHDYTNLLPNVTLDISTWIYIRFYLSSISQTGEIDTGGYYLKGYRISSADVGKFSPIMEKVNFNMGGDVNSEFKCMASSYGEGSYHNLRVNNPWHIRNRYVEGDHYATVTYYAVTYSS